MALYHPLPAPLLRLFRLTLQRRDQKVNVYAMGENVEDAFGRYLARVSKMKEDAAGLEFIQGDLANPHAQLHQ